MLRVETFTNEKGGNTLYKALSHPWIEARARNLVQRLEGSGPVAIYDPHDAVECFDSLYGLGGVNISGFFVQKVERLDRMFRGLPAQPVTALAKADYRTLFVPSFDEERLLRQLGPLLSDDSECLGFAPLRLPAELLGNPASYLSPLNFATNFAFFRDQAGLHTRITTAQYWSRYGAGRVAIWCCLFDQSGDKIAVWTENCDETATSVVIDSREVRARFALPEFTGQLFLHVIGAAGHDVVKYNLTSYSGDTGGMSATHDANSWPASYYAGLPAPGENEKVILWVQNSHPRTVQPGEIGLSIMGREHVSWLQEPVGPFATRALNTSELFPGVRWPAQFEVHAGRHMVRPRYEVTTAEGRSHISHVNVERADIHPDQELAKTRPLFGKGHILPAPILPPDKYRSLLLPTPMARSQQSLPIKLAVFNSHGEQIAELRLGNIGRGECRAIDLTRTVLEAGEFSFGHVELMYDFEAGENADGWLHALFRYIDRQSDHQADTSFGAHIFNDALTYGNEPQSYSGPPPGVSTRLFLPVWKGAHETWCHLIYPVSQRWQARSQTSLCLISDKGTEVARTNLEIPASGSRLWRIGEFFDSAILDAAGSRPYVIIRDETCRLFGYQGAFSPGSSFSFDHMFGF